jgi:hypothetical protein
LKKFKQSFDIEPGAKAVQDAVREKFQDLDIVPFLSGSYLQNIRLSNTVTNVPHKLERAYRGYIVLKYPQGLNDEPWTSFTPTISADGSLTWTSLSIAFARYSRSGNILRYSIRLQGTLGGVADNAVFINNLPFPAFDDTSLSAGAGQHFGSCAFFTAVNDTGYTFINRTEGPTTIQLSRRDSSNFPTAGTLLVGLSGFYFLNESNAYYGPGVSLVEPAANTKDIFIPLVAEKDGLYDLWIF